MTSRSVPAPVLADQVLTYLESRGIHAGPGARVTPLADGVSARVYLVESRTGRWVVKQALPELLVDAEWLASPLRSLTEGAAIELLHGITPRHVPELIDSDPIDCVVTMTAAPVGMTNWRQVLLGDDVGEEQIVTVARELGEVLGAWHSATWGDPSVREAFSDDLIFEQLRISPFHRTVASEHPELGAVIGLCIDDLQGRRECLVHGDFSPKNVLVSAEAVWVLDFEVARVGAAVFDLAFFSHHLAIKAVARPHLSRALRAGFDSFLEGYELNGGRSGTISENLGWHTAILMLARVDGVSRANYLSHERADHVRAIAVGALRSADSGTSSLWESVIAS